MHHIYLPWIAGGLAAYLLGALPFGFLIARARGVDIRKVGSGNIGATNVFRCVSKPLGIVTFALDVGKGFAGCTLIPWLAVFFLGGVDDMPLRVGCGFLAVIGHNWPVYLRFKGGKGVATSAGLLLGLAPLACAVALGAFIVTVLISRYVSLSSIMAAVALGVAAWPFCPAKTGWWFPVVLDVLAALAIWRHRGNIRRLLAGTESRLGSKKNNQPASEKT